MVAIIMLIAKMDIHHLTMSSPSGAVAVLLMLLIHSSMRLHSFVLNKHVNFFLMPVSVLVKVTYPWIHAIDCNNVQSLA